MTRKIIFLFLCCLVSMGAMAQKSKSKVKEYDTYNYKRALEYAHDGEYEKALESFANDVKENPKSGYPYVYMSIIQLHLEKAGEALESANKAVQLLPKKDLEMRATAHAARAEVYLTLGDSVSALTDYAEAIKLQPEEEEYLKDRAQPYYELNQYDLADKDYQRITEVSPGSIMGFMGLGRNCNMREEWEKAAEYFTQASKLDNEYSSAYSFRAVSNKGMKKYSEAMDDIIKAIEMDNDSKAFYELQHFDSLAYPTVKAKLKLQMMKKSNEFVWPYAMAIIEEQQEHWKEAAEYYIKANELEPSETLCKYVATCYDELGDTDSQLLYLDKGLELDSTETELIVRKAYVYLERRDNERALELVNSLFNEEDSETYNYFNFYTRGHCYYVMGEFEKAVEDYTMAISDDDSLPFVYFGRARAYHALGKTDLAKPDFEKVVELDSMNNGYNYRMYAHYYLGDRQKAVECLDSLLKEKNSDGNNYDAACLYSLMGETDKALDYLETSLKKGYRSAS